MTPTTLSCEALLRALHLRDLTDPQQGAHAMQQLVSDIRTALTERWRCTCRIERSSPIVPVADNYDRLGYPPEGASRDTRYTRYLSEHLMLRSQMSAVIPGALRALLPTPPDDLLLVCPGLVYRRDVIDRLHVGEPHQLDLWRVTRKALTRDDLLVMIAAVVETALPGAHYRTRPASHPYTREGLEIEALVGDEWVEIGECGLAAPEVLAGAGLGGCTGLAMGLGLDRLLMLRKGIDDIRLLRSDDPRVKAQMEDLEAWRPVSNQPPTRRDLSVAVSESTDPETLGDQVREAMGETVDWVEGIEWLDETPYDELPPQARERMGMHPGLKNVLLRITLRHPTRTLTSDEANRLRDTLYAAIHAGSRHEWARPQG